ncbi:MAG: ATP-dependent DNA helicase RecG [Planctomycetota bacterium]
MDRSGSLRQIRGIGPVLAARIAAAGFPDVRSLAFAFPRRYRETVGLFRPGLNRVGEVVGLVGRCKKARARRLPGRRNLAVVRFEVLDGRLRSQGCEVEADFFGQSYLARSLPEGKLAVFSGRLEHQEGRGFTLRSPRLDLDVGGFSPGRKLEAVHAGIEGISPSRFGGLARQAMSLILPELGEDLPEEVLDGLNMCSLPEAARILHWPPADRALLETARRRLAYREARLLLESVRERRRKLRSLAAMPIATRPEVDRRIRSRLPFELSAEQEACVTSLRRDLAQSRPMARLLQGDVGTGKTLVAVYGCLAAAASGLKAVLLAPTEALAEQHAGRISAWLAGSRLPVVLLTASLGSRQQAEATDRLRGQRPCIAIGTHALLSDKVSVSRLGLLVIDEQHRFGVAQRAKLFKAREGLVPHVLVMSATPIPRTLATAIFGDLDCSEIRRSPVQRPPVRTRVLAKEDWPRVRRHIVREVGRGGRVFVVCPRIGAANGQAPGEQESSAVATHRELEPLVPAVLVHGHQSAPERRSAQAAFREGRAACLVGTTVLEVGIDVPEATWMVVRDAERLGLSPLHQLRGRIGRGGRRGLCLVLADRSCERLVQLERSADGFELAEADLRTRGAGELTGRQQHGRWGTLQCLDPFEDLDLLKRASTETGSSS